MAIYINEPSHTFNEYLLIPGYSSCECMPANVSLKTPLVKYRKDEKPAIELTERRGLLYLRFSVDRERSCHGGTRQGLQGRFCSQ